MDIALKKNEKIVAALELKIWKDNHDDYIKKDKNKLKNNLSEEVLKYVLVIWFDLDNSEENINWLKQRHNVKKYSSFETYFRNNNGEVKGFAKIVRIQVT